MIRISRGRVDAAGNPIQPDAVWFADAAVATALALSEGSTHSVRKAVYGHEKVRRALEELFYRKCAYCEISIARFDWDVEHYRPKGTVAERPDPPGYYWLAYDWENLFPSCQWCNQNRKAKPLWGGDPGIAGGKLDQFPISPERTRAMNPGGNIAQEGRLLLNPCADRPTRHLAFTLSGDVRARNRSRKGEVSIRVFKLKEPRLRLARREWVDDIVGVLRVIENVAGKLDAREVQEVRDTVRRLTADEKQFSGVAKYIVENPEEFGVDPQIIGWAI